MQTTAWRLLSYLSLPSINIDDIYISMAQKRNPISLRLQTRLGGYEKRFASCWFTDCFFSQAYTNDLIRRSYLGHLLGKGGSWYGERSESLIPETCISIQFLYRKCSILSVVLDRRKQEYALSTFSRSNQSKGEGFSTFSRVHRKGAHLGKQDGMSSDVHSRETGFASPGEENILDLNGQYTFLLATPGSTRREMIPFKHNDDNVSASKENTSRLFKRIAQDEPMFSSFVEKADMADTDNYLSAAILFGTLVTGRQGSASLNRHLLPSCITPWCTLHKSSKGTDTIFSRYNVLSYLPPVSTIEYICDLSEKKGVFMANNVCINSRPLTKDKRGDIARIYKIDKSIEKQKENCTTHKRDTLTPSLYWSSIQFIRATSSSQSVEFCLYSVLSLYKKRVPFSLIKDIFFRMLASSGIACGARLVCSGRQGGRSKSAMRAKKQSALWGQSALSLFASRLAFASTSVDTSFGQIGMKVWICYYSK